MNRKFQHTNLGSHKQWVILAAGCVSVLLFLWLFIGYTSTHANHGAACTDDLLFEWARKHGAQVDNVQLADFTFEAPLEGGANWLQRIRTRRGLMSMKNLSRGDVILSVPTHILFSVENANKTELAEVIAARPEIGAYTILALFLLQEHAKGSNSHFFPYICKIPSAFSTTIFWPLERLGLWPDRSNLVLQTRRLQAALRQHYNQHFPLLFRLFPHLFNSKSHSFARVVWALTAVYSRNWGVNDPSLAQPEVVGGRVVPPHYRSYHIAYGNASNVMAPVADMLNHDVRDTGAIAWVPSPSTQAADGGSEMTTRRPDDHNFAVLAGRGYEVGEELFTTYGQDCNARFQVGYGFAPMTPWEDLPCQDDLSSAVRDAARGQTGG
mmetsp:Transcript_45608/g.108121  ORF Transcript_45608/g.108121 Transcript_45608/m.108121 type:complete len:381 (-) Transcript_45608:123-1265(-)|eukprot:CAMPEP_0177717064 /NCGR_PEP_ID=MMETSP0484_2-20121128/14832_1 /TAXON_ID=354590 /ORGANISM="Rhodomonas lens, Strain RHODO" /LENGTH=380 /DNA_ID=CAMNT_0019229113 /DNA_START=79 /DNA_END=1221 /DNA_ORIENTATION=+